MVNYVLENVVECGNHYIDVFEILYIYSIQFYTKLEATMNFNDAKYGNIFERIQFICKTVKE